LLGRGTDDVCNRHHLPTKQFAETLPDRSEAKLLHDPALGTAQMTAYD
jgi:hypothetical protein